MHAHAQVESMFAPPLPSLQRKPLDYADGETRSMKEEAVSPVEATDVQVKEESVVVKGPSSPASADPDAEVALGMSPFLAPFAFRGVA